MENSASQCCFSFPGCLVPQYGDAFLIGALSLLLVFQLIGEVIARAFDLPVPGPVIGMGLLLVAIILTEGPSAELQQTTGHLLQHLSLLFVPAGVGIMLYFQLMADAWLPLAFSLIISTFITIAVTALVLISLIRLTRAQGK